MSTIKFPKCLNLLRVTPGENASRVKCPGCETILQIPASSQTRVVRDRPSIRRHPATSETFDLSDLAATDSAPRPFSSPSSATSLPCVLVAPAGTPLLHGVGFPAADDYSAETLPYAEAGMVAIQYSLDGSVPDMAVQDDALMMTAVRTGFLAFSSSVFHARDDGNVPFQDAERFIEKAKHADKQVKFVIARSGGHYQSMIDEGIPAAIQWLAQ